VIRTVLMTAVALLAVPVLAKTGSAQADRKSARRDWHQLERDWHHLELDLPDIPFLPGLPELDLSGIEIDLPELLAKAMPHDRDPDEPDADEEDPDQEVQPDEDRNDNVKVYKLNRQRSIRLPRVRLGEESDSDERDATAQAKGRGSATLQVNGPITFQIRAQSGEVEVISTDKRQVSVTLSEAPPEDIALYAFGDRVEPAFHGRRTLRRGKLRVEIPRGSRLDLSSMSGDVSAQRIGDVRVRTMSGDVRLAGVAKVDVQTISGDAHIEDASGPVRLHTVSGHVTVATSGTAPQVEFQSASGSLDWAGMCARDCHLSAETVSGDVRLNVDPRSSFELSYTSHTGELRDEANLAVKRTPRRKHGMSSGWLEATFGKGEGVIEADAFSGSLVVKRK
jgi:Putative adhesin